MHVISKSRLREYWQRFPITEMRLREWYSAAEHSTWLRWADLIAMFPQADLVGDCVVFNIGNGHRLIGRVRYRTQRLYVLRIMSHSEYDKRAWPDECGCFKPPPKLPRNTPS